MSVGTLGTTRNRTDIFLKYRKHARGASRPVSLTGGPERTASTSGLLAAAIASHVENGHDIELGTAGVAAVLPPQYVDFKEEIRTEMVLIRHKMDELKALHSKTALTRFDDFNRDEADIEVITQEITRLFRKCEVRLQRFGSQVCSNESDEKVKHNVQRTLALELQRLSMAFRKHQKQYLNRIRQKDSGATSSSFPIFEESTSSRYDDDYDPGFTETQGLRVDSMESLARERDEEVKQILQSIHDLAQIMKDLSVLVIDQGTILDRIDYNIEQVAVKIDEGVKQLTKAEKTQKANRLVMCIMLLLCAVIFMLFIVIIKALF